MKRFPTALLISAVLLSPVALHAQQADLPEELRSLGLTDLRDRKDDGERRIGGRLADGTELRIEYDRDGQIEEIETGRGGTVPADLLSRILPPTLMQAEEYRSITRVTDVEIDRDEVKVEGFTAEGAKIEIEASPSGAIHSYQRKTDREARANAMGNEAAQTRLTELGYTDPGQPRTEGRDIAVQATNPNGERVELRLDEQGRITRERAAN